MLYGTGRGRIRARRRNRLLARTAEQKNEVTSETLFDIVRIIRHGRSANVEEVATRDGKDIAYTRRLMLALSHSRPSYKPSPLVAQAACETREPVHLAVHTTERYTPG